MCDAEQDISPAVIKISEYIHKYRQRTNRSALHNETNQSSFRSAVQDSYKSAIIDHGFQEPLNKDQSTICLLLAASQADQTTCQKIWAYYKNYLQCNSNIEKVTNLRPYMKKLSLVS